MTRIPNSIVVAALPDARKLYRNIEEVIVAYYAENNKLTFENVKTIAAMVAPVDSAIYVALTRIIECENCITIELETL